MRLDHLLSKEHTPRPSPFVWGRMVVFTSGIVDERPLSWVMTSQYGRPTPFGGQLVWNLGWWRVGEGLAHCWALRNQAPVPVGAVPSGGSLVV